MSLYAFDPELEQKLNDIDEFIRSQCGDELAEGFDQSEWLLPSNAGEAPPQPSSCNVKVAPSNTVSCGARMDELSTHHCSTSQGPEVRVQILNLMDIYDKKTTKTSGKYEYRLGSSEVTIVAHSSEEIKRVRVYVQRCPEATVRTHDTTGPVELEVDVQHHSQSQTVVSVDLGSVHRTEEGFAVYRLDKSDIVERNKWELVIMIGFHTGIIAAFKSKPFRITTRASQRARNLVEQEDNTMEALEDVLPRASAQSCDSGTFSTQSCTYSTIASDTSDVVKRVASKLRQEFSKFNLKDDTPCPARKAFRTDPLVLGKVVLRPDTTLDKTKVAMHYNRDMRARYVVEQPDLPNLLKLMNLKANCASSGRRRANGFKTAEEDFWWACGLCFFERRKKSTVKAHVAQRVCQKTSLRKELKQRRKAMGHLKRYSSCDFSSERLEGLENWTWEGPQSV
ncbi:unnamed protein product [Porites evermanni]|uniref:Uncharacterized protein n=1 Tax=Porites evermanni TaxID=104178 RepID=A0ABN8LWJ2_9CNID|nr:unnamed protein product [Porites evermanni]